jgi:hypothetical protein
VPKRQPLEPETRVGICCGAECNQRRTINAVLLFKIQGMFRYRCATCFLSETGYRHHLSIDQSPQPQEGL